MLELDRDFFGMKTECVGAGISGGGPPWAHETGVRPGGVGAIGVKTGGSRVGGPELCI